MLAAEAPLVGDRLAVRRPDRSDPVEDPIASRQHALSSSLDVDDAQLAVVVGPRAVDPA